MKDYQCPRKMLFLMGKLYNLKHSERSFTIIYSFQATLGTTMDTMSNKKARIHMGR